MIPEIFATKPCLHSLSTDIFQCDGCLFVSFCVGAHGWVALLCQPWGRYFNLGAGCQTWKFWILQAPNLHLAMQLLMEWKIKSTQSTCKTFYPEAVVLFKYWLISPVNYFLLLLVDHLLCHHEDDTKALLIIVKVFNNLCRIQYFWIFFRKWVLERYGNLPKENKLKG